MDIYLTLEEKYLQALEELWYGEPPKALQLLKAIIADDPLYARAHYQLGKIYYYHIYDYQSAGYHFKTCAELEPQFPVVYEHYLHLLAVLGMERQLKHVSGKALTVPGVNAWVVYGVLGLYAERKKQWNDALQCYDTALLEAACKSEQENSQESIQRVKEKLRRMKKFNYELSE